MAYVHTPMLDIVRVDVSKCAVRRNLILGQDDRWVTDWVGNTFAKFGDTVSAKTCDCAQEAIAFLMQ